MPTYEYACPACDATHEVQQKMSDPTLTECPVCGSPGVRKLFSGVGIHFKGSGFYRTDSRDGKPSGSSGTSAAKSGDGGGSSGSGSSGDSAGGSSSGGSASSSGTSSSGSSSGSSTSSGSSSSSTKTSSAAAS